MTALWDWAGRIERALDPVIAIGSILFGLLLACAAASFLAMARSKAAEVFAAARVQDVEARCHLEVESVRASVADLTSQLDEVRHHTAIIPVAPKPGFNLAKRSEALRLHRRGAAAPEIAVELGIPTAEVDLLLKVHRIVIRNL